MRAGNLTPLSSRFVYHILTHDRSNHEYIQASEPYTSSLQRLLLLCIPYYLPLHHHSLARSHLIYILLRDSLSIPCKRNGRQQKSSRSSPPRQNYQDKLEERTFLPKILQLLFRLRHPKRILVQNFKPREHELRLSGTGRALADLVREAERFGDGQEREDAVEGRAFLEGFGEDVAAAAGEGCVDAAEDFGCGVGKGNVSCLLKSRIKEEVGRKGEGRGLLDAWISQLYMASMRRGDQSIKPWRMESRTVFMTSPVSRPSWSRAEESSSEDVATVTSSRKTATPCMGSWHIGPWAVASWKA